MSITPIMDLWDGSPVVDAEAPSSVSSRKRFLRAGMAGIMLASGKAWTNPYVTEGLVAMWDAEWNAGGGVHDDNATVWKDIAGTYDLDSLSSSLWQDKAIIGDILATVKSLSAPWKWLESIFNEKKITFEIVGSDLVSSQNRDFRLVGGVSGSYFSIYASTAYGAQSIYRRGCIFPGNFLTTAMGSGVSSFTQKGDTASGACYIKGNRVADSSALDFTYISSTYSNNSSRGTQFQFNGSLHCVRVYNRVLTDEEVALNWAKDLDRFGLD